MEKIIRTVPGKCRKKREKARLTLNNSPEISWYMKIEMHLQWSASHWKIECTRCSWAVAYALVIVNNLQDCQIAKVGIFFHFDASLLSVNLAKVKALEKGTVLSMASVKVLCHNIFLMQRFISVLGIEPNLVINWKLWEEGMKFAAIAA